MTARTAPLALVTGPSSGIGRQIAREFVEHGFDVVVNAEDDRIRAAADTLSGTTEAIRVRAGLTTAEGVEELWRTVLARAGRSTRPRSTRVSVLAAPSWTPTSTARWR